jgi:hypothetical protein
MILVNEKVEHISFGVGVVTEERNNKIWVQFQYGVEIKAFLHKRRNRCLIVANRN